MRAAWEQIGDVITREPTDPARPARRPRRRRRSYANRWRRCRRSAPLAMAVAGVRARCSGARRRSRRWSKPSRLPRAAIVAGAAQADAAARPPGAPAVCRRRRADRRDRAGEQSQRRALSAAPPRPAAGGATLEDNVTVAAAGRRYGRRLRPAPRAASPAGRTCGRGTPARLACCDGDRGNRRRAGAVLIARAAGQPARPPRPGRAVCFPRRAFRPPRSPSSARRRPMLAGATPTRRCRPRRHPLSVPPSSAATARRPPTCAARSLRSARRFGSRRAAVAARPALDLAHRAPEGALAALEPHTRSPRDSRRCSASAASMR